ncbi:MAG: SRPBCC family protein [Bacteroidota bacterium]
MTVLEFTSSIPASRRALFEFHTDFTNVKIVTPPFIRLRFAAVPLKMMEGSRMTVEIFQGIRWMPWDVTVEKLVPDSLLVDVQSGRGPFRYWKHEHIISDNEGSIFLTDRLHYQLPFGFIGKIADLLFFRMIHSMLFSYRHKKTKEFFQQYDRTT